MLEDDYAPANRNLVVPIGLPILVLILVAVFVIARRRGG
jgi:hypothetical protein